MFMYEGVPLPLPYDVWVWGEGTLGCLCTRVSPSPCRMMCGCRGREHWDVYVRGCMMCECGGGNIGMFMYEGVPLPLPYDVWVWGEGTLGCLCTRVSPSPCRMMCGCGGREHWDVYVRGWPPPPAV